MPLSVDTSKPEVARACLAAGAHIINDVTGLADPDMAAAARASGAGVIVMHMQGTPATMQLDPHYDDVVNDILRFFEERIAALTAQGLQREAMVIDPGLGFGKRFQHNLQIMARLAEFQQLGLAGLFGGVAQGLHRQDHRPRRRSEFEWFVGHGIHRPGPEGGPDRPRPRRGRHEGHGADVGSDSADRPLTT